MEGQIIFAGFFDVQVVRNPVVYMVHICHTYTGLLSYSEVFGSDIVCGIRAAGEIVTLCFDLGGFSCRNRLIVGNFFLTLFKNHVIVVRVVTVRFKSQNVFPLWQIDIKWFGVCKVVPFTLSIAITGLRSVEIDTRL